MLLLPKCDVTSKRSLLHVFIAAIHKIKSNASYYRQVSLYSPTNLQELVKSARSITDSLAHQ